MSYEQKEGLRTILTHLNSLSSDELYHEANKITHNDFDAVTQKFAKKMLHDRNLLVDLVMVDIENITKKM